MLVVDARNVDPPLECVHVLEKGVFDGVLNDWRSINAPAVIAAVRRSEEMGEVGTQNLLTGLAQRRRLGCLKIRTFTLVSTQLVDRSSYLVLPRLRQPVTQFLDSTWGSIRGGHETSVVVPDVVQFPSFTTGLDEKAAIKIAELSDQLTLNHSRCVCHVRQCTNFVEK